MGLHHVRYIMSTSVAMQEFYDISVNNSIEKKPINAVTIIPKNEIILQNYWNIIQWQ